MLAPKLPSFFKSKNPKKFKYTPRYYDAKKERRDQKLSLRTTSFSSDYQKIKKSNNARIYKIIFLIIVLYLLAYELLIK